MYWIDKEVETCNYTADFKSKCVKLKIKVHFKKFLKSLDLRMVEWLGSDDLEGVYG